MGRIICKPNKEIEEKIYKVGIQGIWDDICYPLKK